jgi:putative colanic acid biosynthesis UDP-glucose lipid carrier transferase
MLLFVDVLATVLTFLLAADYFDFADRYVVAEFQSLGLSWLLLWITICLFNDSYEVNQHRRIMRIIGYTLKSSVIHLPFTGAIAYVIGMDHLSFQDLLILYSVFMLTSATIKIGLLLVYRYIRSRDKNKLRVVIVGYTTSGLNLYRYFSEDRSSGYQFLGFFDDKVNHPLVKGDLRALKKFCVRENVNEIFFAQPYDHTLIKDISHFADDNFIRFGILQDIGGIDVSRVHSSIYDNNLPVLSLKASKVDKRETSKRGYQRALSVLRSLNL